MENFQLREGSARKTNTAFKNLSNGTCRSFISTAKDNGSFINEDLRKSRIQNLPNYKRSSLGENVSFIVVFQTIEIERLSNEVELLRVQQKQNQRKLFNAKNYEVQIKQLTEQVFKYEQEREVFTDEIEKLNRIAENLYNQNEHLKQKLDQMDFTFGQKYEAERLKNQDLQVDIERWKARSQTAQKSKIKEIEELKNMMENQRRSTLDREIKEMTTRFQNDKSALENEIRKCRDIINNKDQQIDDWTKRCNQLERSSQEIKRYENLLTESNGKTAMMATEINRLNDLIKNKEQQLQDSKRVENNLSNKIKEMGQWENENGYLKNMIEMKAKEVDQWKAKASRFEEEAVRGKQMVHFVNELKGKQELAVNQINRINNLLKVKMDEIDKYKNKLSDKQNQLSKYKNLENDVAQFDAKMNMMKTENDRVNGILKSRLEEIEGWKKKYSELESLTSRYSMLERDKKGLEDRYNNQLKTVEELKFYVNKLQNQNNQNKKFQKVVRQSESKNDMLMKELDRLNQIIKNNMGELSESKTRFNKLEESMNQYKQKAQISKEYENKIKLLVEQNQRLNQLIANKNHDIENLEANQIDMLTKINFYKNYELKINQFESVIMKLNDINDSLKKELEAWQGKYRQAEAKCRELQSNCVSLQQERERVNNANKSKTSQLDDWKNKCNRLEQECRKKAELDLVCQELHGQVCVYLAELQATQKKSKEIEDAYNKERKQNDDKNSKLNMMNSEIERLNRELNNKTNSKNREVEDLERQVKGHLERVKEKDNKIQSLLAKIEKLEAECQKLMTEFLRLQQIVEKNEKDTEALNLKIEQYKDYAKRIHILGAQMDRLSAENKALQQDNKSMRLKYADNIDFEKKEQSMAMTMILMATEIESLRQRISEREVKMDEMRKSILEPIRKI